MKQFLLLLFIALSASASFAQDSSKHSFALNLGGYHRTPTAQSSLLTTFQFHFAKHIGTTYRLQFRPRQALRASTDYKGMKDERFNEFVPSYKDIETYNEFQMGLGYEFIIRKGKLEPYVDVDFIVVYSKNKRDISNGYNSITTTERLGYGGSMLLGLRYNVSNKWTIGLETNARYLFNKNRIDVVYTNGVSSIPIIRSNNFQELNPISGIVVKYNI